MNIYLIIIVVTLLFSFALDCLVSVLTVKSLNPALPREFEGFYDASEYQRSQNYTRAKTRLGLVENCLSTPMLLACVFLGAFNWLDVFVRGFGFSELATGLLFIGALGLVADLLGLPFSLYNTFVLEERFGFNKITPGLYVKDKIKGWLLSVLIGGPVLAGVLFFFEAAGPYAWVMVWVFTTLILLVLQYLAPVIILPLFNKFTPLEDGPLRQAIEGYAQKIGFSLSGVFIMDGSKRSTKSNAFFTGFGSKKRIALYDTLVEKHTTEEIVSILAHEVGHYKKRHLIKMLITSTLKAGLVFYLLSVFLTHKGLFDAFGMEHASIYAGLVFFSFLYAPVSLIASVGFNVLSRKYEFEADAFAVRTTGAKEPMILALKKLTVSNLGNLTPPKLDVALHHSHPPVLNRVAAIRDIQNIPA